MSRIALNPHEQLVFLQDVKQQLMLTQTQMAQLCQVHPRTFSDWMRGKQRMRYESLQQLIERTGLVVGRAIGQLPEFSHVREAARLGGLQKYKLYGNPGTPEGRRRGGLISIERRRAAAQRGAASDGFTLAKSIRQPGPSPDLAEFIGIMLGDGCLLSAYQAAVYFNVETDGPYADFTEALALKLFGLAPRRSAEPDSKGGALLFSSKRFVDYLMQLGFPRGDKVTHQACVPSWVLDEITFRRSCLRGLMDTDGSIYRYEHTVYGKLYTHSALCFTNRSYPLLQFVEETLRSNGYRPTRTGFRVYVYRRPEIKRYFADIETHNEKHLHRYQEYTQDDEAIGEVSEMAEGAALEKR